MRRFAVSAALASLLAFSVTPSASAGGAPFDFEERYYVPGDIARASSLFWAGAIDEVIEDGPWIAYLLPPGTWIDPPNIPAGAVPLGQLSIVPRGRSGAVAALSFNVPDTQPGYQWVEICNDPCTKPLLDILGGDFVLVPSRDLIPIWRRTDRLETRIDSMTWRLDQSARRVDGLQKRMARVETRMAVTPADAALTPAREGAGQEPAPGGTLWTLASILSSWLAIGAIAAWIGLSLMRRRRTAPALGPVHRRSRWEADDVSAETSPQREPVLSGKL